MGFLAGIKAVLGTPKVVETIADTVKSGVGMLDNAFYTDQEKSTMALKSGELWLRIQEATANENSLKSITRRWLACAIVGSYLIAFFVTLTCVFIAPEKIDSILEIVGKYQLGYLTLGVCSFYFVYYGVQGIIKKD